jgi:exopolyphosphatase/guanosine-5'-triphosphate,3'-diphosphate pyrophosphatase
VDLADRTLIGVAGTATSLAALAQGLTEFDRRAVSNFRLSREVVGGLLGKLSTMPSSSIRRLSSVMEGRADIITAGALILHEVMGRLGASEIVISERGVRYGLALREWEKRRGKTTL